MGCQFPIPLISKNKKSSKFSDKETESRPTFSEYYGKSVCFGEESETSSAIGIKRRKLIASKGARSNIFKTNFEKVIRNKYGRVINSRVSSILSLKAEFPNKSTEEILERYHQRAKDVFHELKDDEYVADQHLSNTMKIEILQTEEADYVRGYIWK